MTNAIEIPAAVISASDDGEPRHAFSGLILTKVPPESTGGAFVVCEQRMRRNTGTPVHRHVNDFETFIVLEGRLTVVVEGEQRTLEPGGLAHVPAGLAHAWRVDSDVARFLVLTTPRHLEFYDAAGDPAPGPVLPEGPVGIDVARVAPLAAAYETEILGPPLPGVV
jgi:quercetin dioxygenase-like cupin family protein